MELNKKLKINNRYTMIDLDDEIHFIPSDEYSQNYTIYKATNNVSIQICRCIYSQNSVQEIIDLLSKEYNVGETIITNDVLKFVSQLRKVGILDE